MEAVDLVRDTRGAVIAEYLDDYTPVVKCRDAGGQIVWREASEVLPPTPRRDRNTPDYNPRRDDTACLTIGGGLGLIFGRVLTPLVVVTPDRAGLAPLVPLLAALLGALIGHLYQRERIARWDKYVRSHDGLVIEDPAVIRHLEESPPAAMRLLVGAVGRAPRIRRN